MPSDLTGSFTEDNIPVPLIGVRVEGTIIGRGARVKITQTFENREEKATEAVYRFPLPEGSAVCGFRAVVGERIYGGTVSSRRISAGRTFSPRDRDGSG